MKILEQWNQFQLAKSEGKAFIRPNMHLLNCTHCQSSGLISAEENTKPDTFKYPHVAIIGGGIGGCALALACAQRGIPFTLFERDLSFNTRSQGYGLTLQQASKAMKGFGIFDLEDGVNSTRHRVYTTDGNLIGEWGMRKSMSSNKKAKPKRTNIHIARQLLRKSLLSKVEKDFTVQWGHQLIDFSQKNTQEIELVFDVGGNRKLVSTNLVVGADGIRSVVREKIFGEEFKALRYLNCIVILGICPLSALGDFSSELLDGSTVFQTANGVERIYVMPYTKDSVMWQLSFGLDELEAKILSSKGGAELKKEAQRRTQWHEPVPAIVSKTPVELISGYPVYDRELIEPKDFSLSGNVTLIGDAAHPMSPFKGQGANQALLDALELARLLYEVGNSKTSWKEMGIRSCILDEFEAEMLLRVASKVNGSATAAKFLHSEIILHEGDHPRGRFLSKK
jgi:2-polyprenyl-6-methoxyphenol hydroxylase-like FAD-dependent oxidoreductase